MRACNRYTAVLLEMQIFRRSATILGIDNLELFTNTSKNRSHISSKVIFSSTVITVKDLKWPEECLHYTWALTRGGVHTRVPLGYAWRLDVEPDSLQSYC